MSSTSYSAVRDNIEEIFARAVKLFLVNYYFKREYKHLTKEELLKIAKTIQINLTVDEANFIQEITQEKNKSWYWQKLRAGRVTSSKFKSVCTCNISNPSKTLLKEICYPETCIFSSDAVIYRNKIEHIALSSFISQMAKSHKSFKIKRVGLIVDVNCPYFATNPDSLCSCTCCGEYLVLIKCPFILSTKNAPIQNLLKMTDPFVEIINETYCLKKDHAYYYQLQMQMALCKYKFSYFYVWSSRVRITNKIYFDSVFWTENSAKAYKFAKEVLTIELMNSYYTKTY